MTKRMEEALNKQINAEFWSAYFYLSMSTWFEEQNLPGFANWMRVQFQEETSHALKFVDYVNERGGRVMLEPIAEVETNWESVIHVFEETLKHEKHVTQLIYNLMDIAIEEKDHATQSMLKWFIDEQVEEEASVDEIINQIKMFDGKKGPGMFMMDKEFRGRTFVDATQEA
jgi:ferritin